MASCLLLPLPQSKRTTTGEEAPAEEAEDPPVANGKASKRGSRQGGQQASGQPHGADLHFDALEQQINQALLRLSLSEEQVAASLRRAQGGAAGPHLAQQAPAGVQGECQRLACVASGWEQCMRPTIFDPRHACIALLRRHQV